MSALLLDELMGRAYATVGPPALTLKLEMRYRRPVPLETRLVLTAEVIEVAERRRSVRGTICAEADLDRPLVEADGLLVVPRPDQSDSLFAGVSRAE
ncbi:PaaI family thioesterase [Streptomyces humidus]|uniref:PaaI family thioesterase n=1 Tax=Streptomyces humidus TaxID=52259 RepID=UPI00227D86C6|nr:hotdog domain-containing protein [Streptomyces humidus]